MSALVHLHAFTYAQIGQDNVVDDKSDYYSARTEKREREREKEGARALASTRDKIV